MVRTDMPTADIRRWWEYLGSPGCSTALTYGAGRTHDGHELPFGDGEGDATQGMDRFIAHLKVAPDIL